MVEQVFDASEMKLLKPKKEWDVETLLAAQGLFFYKDVCARLGLSGAALKRFVHKLDLDAQVLWDDYGIRKVWTHWVVHMGRFAPVYRAVLKPLSQTIPKEWDGNRLLAEKGVFLLVHVCKLIPFTTHQLRYQARNCRDSRKDMGVWKDPDEGHYLVDMAVFGPWVKNVWQDPSLSATAKSTKKTPGKRPKAKPAPRPAKAGI